MEIYIYAADCYCERCGEALRARLTEAGEAPAHPEDEYSYDSGSFPKGPYEDGGGASDCVEHCASGADCLSALTVGDMKVGCWLENPLTREGVQHLRETIAEDPESEVVKLWAEWYKEELSNPL